MTFTVFINKKRVGTIEAKNLDDSEKVADKEYPKWTEIYIGDRKDN